MFDFHNARNQLDHLHDRSKIKTAEDLREHPVLNQVGLH
jgi:hypothetical protein